MGTAIQGDRCWCTSQLNPLPTIRSWDLLMGISSFKGVERGRPQEFPYYQERIPTSLKAPTSVRRSKYLIVDKGVELPISQAFAAASVPTQSTGSPKGRRRSENYFHPVHFIPKECASQQPSHVAKDNLMILTLPVAEQNRKLVGWAQMWGHASPPISSSVEQMWSWTGLSVTPFCCLSF